MTLEHFLICTKSLLTFNSLNPAKWHIMSQVLENVALVIVDEVFMVTADRLAHIHKSMNDVKSRNGATVFFGDCTLILVGDLIQLCHLCSGVMTSRLPTTLPSD